MGSDAIGERMGVVRPSFDKNALIVRSELGKVKKCTHRLPNEEFAYGISKPRDPEGAREVSMIWVAHQGNPDAKPGPDFLAMNKAGASTCVTAADQHKFRETHDIRLKKINPMKQSKLKTHVKLPSDDNPDYTFGRSSSNRPVEETRLTGEAPNIKNVVGGAFMDDWVKMNSRRQASFNAAAAKIPPNPTKATLGHSMKATMLKEGAPPKEVFKMSKFKNVKSRAGPNYSFQ